MNYVRIPAASLGLDSSAVRDLHFNQQKPVSLTSKRVA